MKLTDDDRMRMRKAFLSKEKAVPMLPPCVLCGETSWQLDTDFAAVEASADKRNIKSSMERESLFPLMTLICGNCGNTHFINLRIIGVDDLIEDVEMGEKASSGK